MGKIQEKRDRKSKPERPKGTCKKASSVEVVAKAPVDAVSLLNINSLPDLPFGAFFEWIPLSDLLSAQFVCHQWKEAAIREASAHRDSITLCIDGQAENQKTTRYLERSLWNIPHAEVLKTDDGKPLYFDYISLCKRSSLESVLLGTRQDNPTLLDETLETAQKNRKRQANYDRSFEALLDQKVSQLLTLFPRGPRTLTIVCRSEHRDFLRLLPLLNNWKDNLVTLNLYSSHPRAMDTDQCASHYGSSHLVHVSNRPLRDVLNCMFSLRHLTLDLLGEETDTLYDGIYQNNFTIELSESGELYHQLPNFTFFTRLESFTFADRTVGAMIWYWLSASTLSSPPPSLQRIQIGNSLTSMDDEFRTEVLPFSPFMRHLHVHPNRSSIGPMPSDVGQDPPPFASLSSLFLNLLHTSDRSLSFFLQYLNLTVGLIHLRLHLTGEQVTRWFGETELLRENQRPSLPRLRVLSLILIDNEPIDHRLPSIFQVLFPSLQVIILYQRLIVTEAQFPTQFLEPYCASIRRHFSESLFPESSSFLLLEARLFLYQVPHPNMIEILFNRSSRHREFKNQECLNLLQNKEHIWSVEELRATFQ